MIDGNLFFYILTFTFAFLMTAILEKKLIPILRKGASQPIYTEGPSWHISKQGTPTMGGLGFLISISLLLLSASLYLSVIGENYFALSLIITVLYATANSFIGIIDDRAKIRKSENLGLSPIQKLLLQGITAFLFLLARSIFLETSTVLYFSLGSFDIGILYYPLSILMLLGTVNCANLTDGVDGIATGVAFAIGLALSYLSVGANYEVGFISFALMGAAIAFLIFNLHPAKIFMGDTGSLLLGSLTAAACFSLGNPLIIIPIGGVYVLEGISVILQVIFFKITGKRIFKMAPLHHHLEKCGWTENKIVIWAVILTLILSVTAGFIFV